MKKRIAIAIDTLTGGGAEKIVLTLAEQFQQMGHEVHILVMHDERLHTIPDGIHVHICFDLPLKKTMSVFRIGRSISDLKSRINEIEKQYGKFDIFYSNLDSANQLMIGTGVAPLYCVIHSTVEQSLKRQAQLGPIAYYKLLSAIKCLNGQKLICVSNGIREEIVNTGRIKPAEITTIYNPFDSELIKKLSSENNPEIPEEDFIVHVGRFAKSKRHDLLFKALLEMNNNIKLVLLCKNTKKAVKAVNKYGVADRVIIPGFQSNPFPWVKKAKALVLCSDFEGLPNVLIEGIQCQTPVVSTDCPFGPNEILTGELAECLVPMNNVSALAAKIDWVLENKPNMANAEILDKVKVRTIAEKYLELAH